MASIILLNISIFILFLSSCEGKPHYTQKMDRKIDSVQQKELNYLHNHTTDANRSEHLKRLDSLINNNKNIGNDFYYMKFLFSKFHTLKTPDSSQRYEIIKLINQWAIKYPNDSSVQADKEYMLGLYSYLYNEYPKAIPHFFNALKLNNNRVDYIIFNSNMNLAGIANAYQDHNNTVNFLRKCKEKMEQKSIFDIDKHFLMAISFFNKKSKDSAIYYYNSAIHLMKKYEYSYTRSYYYATGMVQEHNGLLDSALISYKNAFITDDNNIMSLFKIISIYEQLKNKDSISHYMQEIKKLNQKFVLNLGQKYHYLPLMVKFGPKDSTHYYLNEYTKLVSQMLSDNNLVVIQKQMEEIERLKFNDALKVQIAKKEKKISYIIITLLTIIILGSFKIYQLQLKRKNAENKIINTRLESIKEERDRISKELHDDLGVSFTRINMAIHSLLEQIPNNKDVSIISNQNKIINSKMNEIIWFLNARNDSTSSLSAYIVKFTKAFLGHANIKNKIENECSGVDAIDKTINFGTRRTIYLAVKEWINNIVRHSHANEVLMHISMIGNDYKVTINDNGIGIKDEIRHSGNGLKNIKEQIQKIGGNTTIETSNSGTTILINIPI